VVLLNAFVLVEKLIGRTESLEIPWQADNMPLAWGCGLKQSFKTVGNTTLIHARKNLKIY